MSAIILHLMIVASSFSVGEGGSVCSLEFPVAARPQDVVVLAVATGERRWIEAEAELPEAGWPIAPGGLPEEVWGQAFRVVRRSGNLEEADDRTLVIVPWEYDPACDLMVWSDPSWVAAGDTVVFTLSREARARTRLGTYHALGWHAPYPAAELIEYSFRGRAGGVPWVSAERYFEMLGILPPAGERGAASSAALRAFREWAQSRALEDRFPVNAILRSWEQAAGGFLDER